MLPKVWKLKISFKLRSLPRFTETLFEMVEGLSIPFRININKEGKTKFKPFDENLLGPVVIIEQIYDFNFEVLLKSGIYKFRWWTNDNSGEEKDVPAESMENVNVYRGSESSTVDAVLKYELFL